MNKKTIRLSKILIIILLITVVLICAFYNKLTIKKYNLHSDKILDGTDIKIVLISDLHSHFYGENQELIINKIKKLNPDIIALAGDIADDFKPFIGAKIFFEETAKIAPTFYVTGNHEIWSGNIDKIKNDIMTLGVNILENDKIQVNINGNNIIIYGIDDPYIFSYTKIDEFSSWDEMLESLWDENNNEKYKLLISHRPEKIDLYSQYDYDLILTGHTHGGQIRIPFILNGLYAPDQGYFPKYAGGLYEYKNTKLIVSRGVSFYEKLPRIFNPPEISLITITK